MGPTHHLSSYSRAHVGAKRTVLRMRTQRGLAQCQYTSGHRPFYCDTKKMDETGQHNVEEDPAASFLAREQDDLAGLVDDTLEFSEVSHFKLPVKIP